MDAMTISQYPHAGLPRLSTSRMIHRRDSLSSSKTRDSGYNSDLETLSPLDLPVFAQDFPYGPVPPVPDSFISHLSFALKKSSDTEGSKQSHRASITSNHTSKCVTASRTRPSAILPDLPEIESTPTCSPRREFEDDIAVHDEDIEKWIRENLPSRDRPKERVSSITSLSSTSSCEMYTSTDMSDDEQEHNLTCAQFSRPRAIVKVIQLIIRKVENNLHQAAHRQCTSRPTTAHRNASCLGSQESSHKASQGSGHKRKAPSEGSPPPNEDDNGQHKRRRGSAVMMGDDSETGAKFACPFYKHDPDQYRNRRTCPGPGWPTVHRMKEHLYRSHAQPIFCPICYATFKSDKEQSNHVRLQQCQRSAPQKIDGIDRETVWTLRKRTTALRLEEDKWRDVYHVLFPDVADGDIPSPFYECDSPSESSRRFRRELLRRVQAELFATADRVPGPVEQQLLQRVAHIIRNCEEDLLRSDTSTADVPATYRRGSTTSTLSMFSTASSSGHATPANAYPVQYPLPLYPPQQLTQGAGPDTGHLTVDQPLNVVCDPARQPSESIVDFTPIIWDDSTYSTFSLSIDWDGIFPPESEAQNPGSAEPFAGLTVSM